MLKAKDLRDQSIEELEATYSDYCKQLYHAVNAMKQSKKAEKPHTVPALKKDIARLLTVIRQKRLAATNEIA